MYADAFYVRVRVIVECLDCYIQFVPYHVISQQPQRYVWRQVGIVYSRNHIIFLQHHWRPQKD